VRDLRRALSFGPSLFEQCYVFRIPTHGRHYTPTANDRLVASQIAMKHHGAGAPALLTPPQRADNLVVERTFPVPVNDAGARASAAAAPMTTTLARAVLGPAAALWLAATKASAPAYASGWQSAVVEALKSWAAGSARKPWRQGGPFVPGLP
jgi:hypothetical protein